MDASQPVYSPSELLQEVRLHLEAGFPRVLLEGEISNLSRPASGHLYFSLKDDKAQVRCALFRSSALRLSLRPENGMKVIARGRLSLYEARGDFQMIVDGLRDAGEGELQRQFEALKKKLQTEGLFEPELKQALPRYPRRIALITSASGAAVRDMLHVLQRRWPLARVRLYPVAVQGEAATRDIVRALQAANRHRWADVVLLGRGGGSLEDLAAFNDETVARSVAASALPVVSAVGHETDFSICDFVADLRAPTPSAAAELASPDGASLARQFAQSRRLLASRMERLLQQRAQHLDHLLHRLNQQHPSRRAERAGERLASLRSRLGRGAHAALLMQRARLDRATTRIRAVHPGRRLESLRTRLRSVRARLPASGLRAVRSRRERLRELGRTLNAISPLQVFERGYAAVSDPRSGRIITRAADLAIGDPVRARLADGSLDCIVERVVVSDDGKDA